MSFIETAKSYYRKFFNQDGNKAFMANSLVNSDSVSKRDQLSLYRGYTYAIISAIAEEVGRIKPFAYEDMPDGSIKEIPNHPFIKVMNDPHPDWSMFEFFEMGQTLEELTGEMFIYLELGESTSEPKGMDLIRPDRMSIAVDQATGIVTGYVVDIGYGNSIPLEKEEVLHIKQPDPENFYRGLGTPAAALDYVQTERQTSRFTKNALLNNGAPAGIVSLQNQINDEDFQEIKAKWNREYGGSGNAGKTAFIRKTDIVYTKVGSSLAEMAITAIAQMSREDLMAMFRTSKVILGITEDVNYNNGSNAKRTWLENVIEPKMFRLTNGMLPAMKLYSQYKDAKIGFRSPVPEDETAKVNLYDKGLNKWLTINDIRRKEKLDPLDGGDMIYQPINYVPVSDNGADATATPTKAKTLKVRVKKKIDKTLREIPHEVKESFRQTIVGNQENYAKLMWKKTKALLKKQKAEVLSNIATPKGVIKNAGEITFNEADWVKKFNDTFIPLVYQLADENGQLAMDFSGNDVAWELSETLKRDVAEHIDRMSRSYNQETLEQLKLSLSEGVLAQEDVKQLTARVNDVYNFAQEFRAERIARSETQFASNTATLVAYKQNPYVISKEWFANPGACEFCLSLNGKTIELDTPYAPDGTTLEGIDEAGEPTGNIYSVTYGDVDSPPAHPNCTCTVLPVRRQG